jgi:hypothetical protein
VTEITDGLTIAAELPGLEANVVDVAGTDWTDAFSGRTATTG